ncbi:MAG: hypothetical protein AB1646_12405 [Thermodesulfobacteriota bacterium]
MKRFLAVLGLGILVFCGWLAVTDNLEPFIEDPWSAVEFFQFLGGGVRVVLPFLAEDTPNADGLPSDEEMIRNFREHRADFEHLAQICREKQSLSIENLQLKPSLEMAALMWRIKITAVSVDQELWMAPDAIRRDVHLQEKMSQGDPEVRRYSGLYFQYGDLDCKRDYHDEFVKKIYYYIPVKPTIDERILMLPGPLRSRLPAPEVVDTLNKYPTHLATRRCALREIELHWYIRMCQEK